MTRLRKIVDKTSADILSRYEPSDICVGLALEDLAPSEAIQRLHNEQQYSDLVQFLCFALPIRDSIWYGVQCLDFRQGRWTPAEEQALEAARVWAWDPGEIHRIRAQKTATRVGLRSGPGWLAQAVFWNGSGSISEPGEEALAPPAYLYAHAVAAAINSAAVMPPWPPGTPGKDAYYGHAGDVGIALAHGQDASAVGYHNEKINDGVEDK